MLGVVRLGVRDVVQHGARVHAEPLRDRDQPLRAERALRVDVHRLALRAALRERELARHRERVAQLRLSGAELAVNLRQRAALEAAAEKLIQLGRARGDHDGVLAALLHHRRGREPEGHHLQGCGGTSERGM